MSIHWQQLSTAEKIVALKEKWEPGMSARHLAAFFDGATRNAVIGLYGRYPEHLAETPLRRPKNSVEAMARARRKTEGVRRLRPAVPNTVPQPVYEPCGDVSGAHVCGKPLMMLRAGQCKWPVNDAAPTELHLFCGVATNGVYCPDHAARARQ